MGLKCGIVGLPNVGKSTLFNALTASNQATAANYPFCTIEPNTAIVPVDDERLTKLAKIANSAKIVPSFVEFVDIAGLVKGASLGEGLGNKFLSHIREVDAIIHVVRCFVDDDITHVYNNIDPIFDIDIIETELALADLESVEARIKSIEKKQKSGDKTLFTTLEILNDAFKLLKQGKPVRSLISKYDASNIHSLQLITSKPIMYICNVLEEEAGSGNNFSKLVQERAASEKAKFIIISSKIEAEIASLDDPQEKLEFLTGLNLGEVGLSKVIKEAHSLLGLKSYFTVGPKEAHSWTFKDGMLAPEAAGIIHTDFEKGFIRAEVISYEHYIEYNGEVKTKEQGKMRLEGKDYRVNDGDVIHFRFNV